MQTLTFARLQPSSTCPIASYVQQLHGSHAISMLSAGRMWLCNAWLPSSSSWLTFPHHQRLPASSYKVLLMPLLPPPACRRSNHHVQDTSFPAKGTAVLPFHRGGYLLYPILLPTWQLCWPRLHGSSSVTQLTLAAALPSQDLRGCAPSIRSRTWISCPRHRPIFCGHRLDHHQLFPGKCRDFSSAEHS